MRLFRIILVIIVFLAFVLGFYCSCRQYLKGLEWSAPVEPNPDFGGKREQREKILELEGPLGGLVPEHYHAQQSTGPAAERTQHHQGEFGDAPAETVRAPFIESKHEKGHRTEGGEPDGGNGIGDFQAWTYFSILFQKFSNPAHDAGTDIPGK